MWGSKNSMFGILVEMMTNGGSMLNSDRPFFLHFYERKKRMTGENGKDPRNVFFFQKINESSRPASEPV